MLTTTSRIFLELLLGVSNLYFQYLKQGLWIGENLALHTFLENGNKGRLEKYLR